VVDVSGLSKDPYKRSRQQERRAAKRLGGRTTPGSGNGWVQKGDVHTDDLLVEYKTTNHLSYRLFEDELLEAEREALIAGRDALFGISFGRSGRNWVVMSEEDYLMLRQQALQSVEVTC
jgi:hypothetical protein